MNPKPKSQEQKESQIEYQEDKMPTKKTVITITHIGESVDFSKEELIKLFKMKNTKEFNYKVHEEDVD